MLAGSGERTAGRSLGRIAWTRLKRDRVAMGGLVLIALLVLVLGGIGAYAALRRRPQPRR